MSAYRVREAGDSALILELQDVIDPAVNDIALALARRIEHSRFDGVRDVVPTYRTVAVHFDPLLTDADALRQVLAAPHDGSGEVKASRLLEVPVRYGGQDGPDLDAVAAFADLSPREVIERHCQVEYRVYMLGFMPGFAYMGLVDERIAAPRHNTPRLRVPAGAVGIAGRQTGVYSVESPGGWKIIGRSAVRVFDAAAAAPALFSPGDRVRFVPDTHRSTALRRVEKPALARADEAAQPGTRFVTVAKSGLLTTIQDEGRWGYQSIGVQVSGAMDLDAHRLANALVGNDVANATLEATIAGPELVIDGPTTVGIAGADLGALLDDRPIGPGAIGICDKRGLLRFSGRRAGARAYVAFSGGIDSPVVLGSRATHVRSGLGGTDGRALRAGDRVRLGAARAGVASRQRPTEPIDVSGGARLRVLRGPHDDRFTSESLEQLLATRFTVSPHSDRMGYRLTSDCALRRASAREMISDVTVVGAVQVPPSGHPILLMADRQTTGGYPQIAVVITADLPRAAQLLPGDWVEFEPCSRADALAALARARTDIGRG